MNFKQATNLLGFKVGRLTVIARAPNTPDNKAAWVVKCTCGNEKVVRSAHLTKRNRPTNSCGCLAKEGRIIAGLKQRAARMPGYLAIMELESRYKRAAREARRLFTLSSQEFLVLVTNNCHYCGRPPMQKVFSGKKEKYNEGFLYSGIDRTDNSKGYIPDNCVSACQICNYAKHSLTYEEFNAYLAALVAFRSKK